MTLLCWHSTSAHALPHPERDDYGDNVRLIVWNPPFAIPNLSAHARFWIQRAQHHWIPNHIASAVFQERATRLRELSQSPDFQELLGARDGFDFLVPVTTDSRSPAMAFDQLFRDVSWATPAPVLDARVSLHLGTDGISIQS